MDIKMLVSFLGILIALLQIVNARPKEPYYGQLIESFQEFSHGVRGIVYAVDENTIFIKGFSYDGIGPDVFFRANSTQIPTETYIIRYPEENAGKDHPVLGKYNNKDVILRLSLEKGKGIKDICNLFVGDTEEVFGEVTIPPNLEIPEHLVLPEFKRLAHGLRSGNITILDAKTFYIPNIYYDGKGPDAYFLVGNGTEPHENGVKVPNEVGSLDVLKRYQGESITIQLPGTLTVYDIEWLAMWCIQYHHNFGYVTIPKKLEVPPALGQNKISRKPKVDDKPKVADKSKVDDKTKDSTSGSKSFQGFSLIFAGVLTYLNLNLL